MMQILILTALLGAAFAMPSPVEMDWRVVGGSDASSGQFPYIISLRTASNSHTCGGTLLSSNWVLTAAHCVISVNALSYTVVAGIYTLDGSGVRSGISSIVMHSDYNSSTVVNDIALLRLSSSIQESSLISYIKLEKTHTDTERDATLSGWGRTSYPGNSPNNLQYLLTRTVTYNTCKNYWSSETILTSQICSSTQSGQGACYGDSGGPLVAADRQIGIVSYGAPCAVGAPDIYTRVSSYVDWVEQITGLILE